ncbi:Fusarubin biosynthesis cluster 4 [Hyphodiscus hymeniophilus]|uniref:Fusarubin biosynthesis cluster 4 n=1 Tax=Hyphodiscus hymeniophilus TaxID=353542 RepID=A0A9P6VNV2_9HELO|nr:Fusarubin biosynthesis cluster 4 [Hyphodiscus hymeniophilus]
MCVAGRASDFVESLLDKSKGDVAIDYRGGDDLIRRQLKEAAGDKPVKFALDAISEHNSHIKIAAVLGAASKITFVLPGIDSSALLEGVEENVTWVASVHGDNSAERDLASSLSSSSPASGGGLAQRPPLQGYTGRTALDNLKEGKASGFKYVLRIAETAGLKR